MLTEDKIWVMEVGKKLDCLVARKVMEWKVVSFPHFKRAEFWQDSNGHSTAWLVGWSPSTDISDAWKVVEKMKGNRQFMCELINQTAGWSDFNHKYELNDWLCSFLERLNPEAICKAALLTKLKEGEQ